MLLYEKSALHLPGFIKHGNFFSNLSIPTALSNNLLTSDLGPPSVF